MHKFELYFNFNMIYFDKRRITMGYFAETFNDIYQSLNEEGHRIGADRDSSNLKKIKK